MDLRQLRYFVAVAEEGSITAAARGLHMTQPPLSLAISDLEKDLGVTLFHRLPRGVALTEAGEHLMVAARQLLGDATRTQESMRAMGAGLSGELRIGAEPIGLWSLVSQQVQRFLGEHQDVSVSLVDAPPGRLLDLVTRGEVDLAVIPSAEPDVLTTALTQSLQAAVSVEVPLELVVPRSWTSVGPGPVALSSLLDHPWVLPMRIPGLRILPEALDEVFARAGRRPARVIEASTPHTGLSLVTGGLAVSVLGAGVAEQLTALATVEVEGGLPSLFLVVLWRRDAPLSPVARRFLSSILG
ncbi:LysR family transcriptional regulator [Ornithinimicrobium faecis]|uniref:LysR family transcriptional regulator n=1 Tax=Ornithinimicrobium faecis TaxID=2934158 RepID=A0ABY4YWU3_9MICO|nr:LysR family transcriptional regulator [Ornithinimicrobium sp. HY1793]USQ81251.1 LysR family transcriptional regulator [Ornithinimicrobium sp. HY1793]